MPSPPLPDHCTRTSFEVWRETTLLIPQLVQKRFDCCLAVWHRNVRNHCFDGRALRGRTLVECGVGWWNAVSGTAVRDRNRVSEQTSKERLKKEIRPKEGQVCKESNRHKHACTHIHMYMYIYIYIYLVDTAVRYLNKTSLGKKKGKEVRTYCVICHCQGPFCFSNCWLVRAFNKHGAFKCMRGRGVVGEVGGNVYERNTRHSCSLHSNGSVNS